MSSAQQMVLCYAQCMLILQMAITLFCITGVYVANAQVDPAFYTELGVNRNATTLQIRKAFRKVALKLHPEKHKDDAVCVYATARHGLFLPAPSAGWSRAGWERPCRSILAVGMRGQRRPSSTAPPECWLTIAVA